MRADRQTDVRKLVVGFRNFAKAPNKTHLFVRCTFYAATIRKIWLWFRNAKFQRYVRIRKGGATGHVITSYQSSLFAPCLT
jgi:hypothetical protein